MKRNFFKALVLVSAIVMIPTSAAYGQTKATKNEEVQEINNGKPYVELYDKNGDLIKSYSDAEIEVLMEEAKEINSLYSDPVLVDDPYVNIYDKNNILVGSSVKGVVNSQAQKFSASLLATFDTYKYGATSFSNNISIAGGSYFYKPEDITINAEKYIEGMLIKLFPKGQPTPSGTLKIGNLNSDIHVPIASLRDVYETQHKIQFTNASETGKTIYLKGGTLYYNKR